ncbi:hypothetical protein SteCoe_3009 [Stentor coeruleus]|uniref:EF-hand domain-containing protein n=1 Tax=Stentor coeruleus TaxID=5963 RepID=A0A1R2CY92_9CILI|nr:hypothetical protein SteCoe_3009 [Stentor coeruleus]
MNFSLHAKMNILGQLTCSLLLLNSLGFSFFTAHTSQNGIFDIGLVSISFQYPSSLFESVDLLAKTTNIINSCNENKDFYFVELCETMPSLQAGGYFYIITLFVLELCVINSALCLWWVCLGRSSGKYEHSHALSPVIYFITLICYNLLSTTGTNAKIIKEGYGMVYCFLIEILLLILSMHYYLVLKRIFANDFLILEEPLATENIKRNFSRASGTHSRGANDTGQSEDDLGLRPMSRRKSCSSSQAVQVDEKVVCKEIIEDLSGEIEKLMSQKNRLEDSTNSLKKLMESSVPDITIYQSNIEAKSFEIKTLKDIIRNLKEKLVEKDIKIKEYERDLSVNKALVQALNTNNDLMVRNLDEKERVLESIRNSGNFKSFDDVSEKDSKRDSQYRYGRFTDSTHAGTSIAHSDRESALDKQIKDQGRSMLYPEESSGCKFQVLSEEIFCMKKPQEYEKIIKDQEELIKSLKDKKNEYKLTIKTLQKNLKDIINDRDRLADDLSSAKESLRAIEDLYIESSNKFVKNQEDWNTEKADIEYSKNILARELEALKSRLKIQEEAMNAEISEATNKIESLKDKLQYYEVEHELAHSEISRLKDLQDLLKADLLDKSSNPSEEIRLSPQKFSKLLSLTDPKYENSLKDLDKSFHSMIDEKDDLRQSCADKDNTIIELSEINQKLSEKIYELQAEPKNSEKVLDYGRSSMQSENSASSSFLSVQEMFVVESISDFDVRNNFLLDKVMRMKKEPPMIYANLWKLMEGLMEEKAKVDKLDLALKRKPRHIAEFTMDFLLSHYGLQSLANKQLKAMTMSLEELNKVNHPYGVLFCRLLGLFHPRPISLDLSVYLLAVQHLFNAIALSNKATKFANHYEILQYGGHASIVDVMELIMKVCKNNRAVGERVIFSIHKESEYKLEIALLKVCGTMAKTGKKPKHFFDLLDNNSTNSLDYHEFVDGIRYTLGIWITQEEAEAICAYIDLNSNGVITMDEWVTRVDFNMYMQKIYAKESLVTKVQVLNAFIEEFELEMIEDYNKLRQTIKIRSLDQIEFENYMRMVEPCLKDHEIIKMFEDIRSIERTKNVSPEGFCIAVLKNKLGGYGIGSFDLKDIASI